MILQCVGKNFVITVLDDPSAPSLYISRVTSEIRIGERVPPPSKESSRTVIQIYGILGFVELLAGRYLVVITEREFVGKVKNQAVFKVQTPSHAAFPFFPFTFLTPLPYLSVFIVLARLNS